MPETGSHSQLAAIRATPVDSTHIRHLYDLGFDMCETDQVLSLQLLNEAVAKSKKINNMYSLANSYRLLGLYYKRYNQKDEAIKSQLLSLQAAKQGKHLFLEAGAYFNIGNLKYWKGEYDSCIDYYLRTDRIFESSDVFKDKTLTTRILDKKKSDLYFNMSAVFNTLKNLAKADEYIDKALAIAHKYQNKTVIAFYAQQKADNYFENGNTEKALRTRLRYLPDLEQSAIPKTHIQGYYQNISQEYFELNKTDSSKIYALKSLRTATEIQIPDGIAGANWQLGRIAMRQHQYDEAGRYFALSSNYLLGSDDPTDRRSYYEVMHELSRSTGNYKDAYNYLIEFTALNDTIQSGERAQQFSEREARYQSEAKDARIKLQSAKIDQKNMLNLLLGSGIVALLIIGWLFRRNYKSKQTIHRQRIAELETEKQLAAAEAVLKGEEQERARLAGELHDGLGGLLSGIKHTLNSLKDEISPENDARAKFGRSLDMLDSSILEMRRLAHNLMPDSLSKFGLVAALGDYCNFVSQSGKVSVLFQFVGDSSIKPSENLSLTVYRIVQELVNNIMKHSGAQQALVQLNITSQMLSITVEDNGRGFDEHLLQTASGIGLNNIRHRVEYLHGSIDMNTGEGKGTSVVIEFRNNA
jgi:signal transduction histidine kinase